MAIKEIQIHQLPEIEKITNEFIEEIKSLLEGKGDETVAKMTSIMKAAAASLNFEKAARIRDGLRALTVMQNQNLVEDFVSMDDRDYISHWREGELVSFTVLKIRGGKLLGRDNFRVESIADDDELLEEFAAAYYSDEEDLPPSVFVSEEDNSKILGEWLENLKPDEKHSQKPKTKLVTVKCSQDDRRFSAENRRHAAILNMAKNNAHEDIIRRLRERGDMPALEELKKLLGLPRLQVFFACSLVGCFVVDPVCCIAKLHGLENAVEILLLVGNSFIGKKNAYLNHWPSGLFE